MARGGRRQGAPGHAYQNRTDLQQKVQVVNDLPYGERKRLETQQSAMPLPNDAGAAVPVAPPAAAAAPVPAGVQDFGRPSERPDEPVTAGLPIGPGQGPEALSSAAPDIIGAQLQALYRQAPNNDLLRLIELHDRGF